MRVVIARVVFHAGCADGEICSCAGAVVAREIYCGVDGAREIYSRDVDVDVVAEEREIYCDDGVFGEIPKPTMMDCDVDDGERPRESECLSECPTAWS